MNNNNRQSINNYSYSRRRNREPAQNENNSGSTPTNNVSSTQRNNSAPRANSSSSMYNSYVSENNYNSYTSSYQPPQNNFNNYSQPPQNSFNNYNQPQQNSFNNYNQPQQNSFNNYNQPQQSSFNNYSQPPQNNFNNNYNQPMQNIMPTYQGYDDPATQSYSGGHHAVEVPLSNKMKKSELAGLLCFLVPFLLAMLLMILSGIFGFSGKFVNTVMPILVFASFIGLIAGIIVAVVVESIHLKNVCTVPVTGHLAGYATKIRHVHHKHRRSTSYTVYAPKYEIFINNRYEIRTLDNFTRNQNFRQQLNLLANPNGYEIIRGGNGGVNT